MFLIKKKKDEAKPPILRRLPVKSNQSEVFYNSKKSYQSELLPSNLQAKKISKSYGDKLDESPMGFGDQRNNSAINNNNGNNKQLQDSLKIFRNNSSSAINSASKLAAQKSALSRPSANNESDNSGSSSSSMSSVASSNDDDARAGPSKTEEKLKKRLVAVWN